MNYIFSIKLLVEHLTHFTDWLGASHSRKYTMWRVGDIATDGLKEIAEWGNTYAGEGEMKANVSFDYFIQLFFRLPKCVRLLK